MTKRLLVKLLLVFASIQAEFWVVHMQQEQGETCQFRYEIEPGPTMETCNIIGTTVLITCKVIGAEPFTVQWHFTNNTDQIGDVNTSTIDASIPRYSFDVSAFMLVNNFYIWTYKLLISKVDSKSVGYYWCSVVASGGMVQPNPSKVVHVADQCSIQEVNTCSNTMILLQQSATGVQCASSARNVSVVAAQNIDCVPSTTAVSEKPTTAVSEKPTTAVSEKPTTPVPPITTTNSITTIKESTTGSASTLLPPNYKPTTPPVTKPKPEVENSTPTEVVFTSTQRTNNITVSENGTDMSQDDPGLPLDVIWLGIGVILAVLLTAVMILLTIIACLQCKKRRIKGLTAPTLDVHAYSEGPEMGIELTRPANVSGKENEAKLETIQEPEYEEIPGNLLQLGSPKILSPSSKPQIPKEDTADSLQYEDVSIPSMQRSLSPYENVVAERDPPEYSRLEHSGSLKCRDRPSTSSTPSAQFSPRGRNSSVGGWSGPYPPVLDDPIYVVANDPPPPPLNPHVKVFKSRSTTNTKDEYSQLDLEQSSNVDVFGRTSVQSSNSDKYHQPMSSQVPSNSRRVVRRKSYDTSRTHEYTPIKPCRPKRKNDYTFPIVATEEKYVSEQGHLYHVLEASNAKKKDPDPRVKEKTSNQNPSINLKSPTVPVQSVVDGLGSQCADTEDNNGPVYHVLEEIMESKIGMKSRSVLETLAQSEP